MVRLRNVHEIGPADGLRYSGHMVQAVRRHPHLAHEAPDDAEAYVSRWQAYRRLRTAKRVAHQGYVREHLIVDNGQAIGKADAWPQLFPNNESSALIGERPIRLAYWHQWPSQSGAEDIGHHAMTDLMHVATAPPLKADSLWLVALPEDAAKVAVLRGLGFLSQGPPQSYEIGDAVTVPRQLWVRHDTHYM